MARPARISAWGRSLLAVLLLTLCGLPQSWAQKAVRLDTTVFRPTQLIAPGAQIVSGIAIHGLASVLVGGSALILKKIIVSPRPDGSDMHSFPSGHSCISFMGAELKMRYEAIHNSFLSEFAGMSLFVGGMFLH